MQSSLHIVVLFSYVDQIFAENEKEDAVNVAALFEAVLGVIKSDPALRDRTELIVQSDNAGSYGAVFTARAIWIIALLHGFHLIRFIHNESGDGKTILDAHFGWLTQILLRLVYVCFIIFMSDFLSSNIWNCGYPLIILYYMQNIYTYTYI